MYNHYIRVDSDGNIIHAFSSAFEQPQDGDILVAEDAGRHYNPGLRYNAVIPRLRYVGGELTERSADELAALWTQYQAEHSPPETDAQKLARLTSENADLLSRLADVELALADVFATGGA